eukprot:2293311-Pleurochrysis_carterae.AAC.1
MRASDAVNLRERACVSARLCVYVCVRMRQSQQTRWNRLKDARKRREQSSKCACASKQPPAGELELLDKAETPQTHART